MTNNNINRSHRLAFELGMAHGEKLTSVDQFDNDASPDEVNQRNIKAYFAGVFSGLNMRLGRLQQEFDLQLEMGEDDLARETEKQCETVYALVCDFGNRYLF